MRVCFILLYVFIVVSGDKEFDDQGNRKKVFQQLAMSPTYLLDDYHLVTRHIAEVSMFRSYRTVSVVSYPVMRDVSDACFTFSSEELHLNKIGSCSPKVVVVNIKHGSYPAVNPDGYKFPKNFADPATREEIHTIELLSDGLNQTYRISNPRPGNWYGVVYIKWEDPRTQKVEQQGLVATCETILYTDLQVKREENIRLIDCYAGLILNYDEIPNLFKCMSIESIEPISFNLTIVNTRSENKEVLFKVQALSFPTDESYLVKCAFDPKANNEQTITFTPNPSAWHYVQIQTIENSSSVADCESYYFRVDEEATNTTVFDLMRDNKGKFFTFDYGLPTLDLQDATSLINISSGEIKSFRFKVNQFLDIGGSLAIEASLLMKSWKFYMGYKREVKRDALIAFTEDSQFFKVVICLDIGHTSIPLETGHCKYNDKVKPALFVLNSTDSESIYDKIIIPFPDGGTWYLTLRVFCDSAVCPCPTSDNGTKYYVDVSLQDKYGDGGLVGSWNETRPGTSECNATLVLSVSSTMCVSGICSNHGTCLFNTFGGWLLSFCSCSAGYGGWECSDDSRMDSQIYMLIAVLLLTLSNILFLFSIYCAFIRLYYTEALIYAFTMVFSTFYHACDAPVQIAFCIIRPHILQFGDFYCGLTSFWVTLLAMSIIADKFRSSLQLIGAIVIAILTTWNMHSFFSFVAPVTVGAAILVASWYYDYIKNRTWKYPKSYYFIYLPLGIVLVSVGLVSYGFLQTEQNYKFVHSTWHMIIAMSVVFLLPDIKRDGDVNPFVPSPNFWRQLFCSVFNRSQVVNAD